MNSYIGETDAKRYARLCAAVNAASLFKAAKVDTGIAVCIAGPEANDVGVLRHVLKFDPKNVLFVDVDQKGLTAARKKWPGVMTFKGPINEVLNKLGDKTVKYLNLDFTGYLTEDREETLSLARRVLVPGAVVTYTFFRGREKENTKAWSAINSPKAMWDASQTSDQVDAKIDRARFASYSSKIQSLLDSRVTARFSALRYTAVAGKRSSPMGILSFQRIPKSMRNSAWRKIMKTSGVDSLNLDRVTPELAREGLRDFVVKQHASGLTSAILAEIVNLNTTNIAAWVANYTRGAYLKEKTWKASRVTPSMLRLHSSVTQLPLLPRKGEAKSLN